MFDDAAERLRSIFRAATSREFQTLLIEQEHSETVYAWLVDEGLFAISMLEGDSYKLGFIDPGRRVVVKASGGRCWEVEGESMVVDEVEDVPWVGLRLSFALSLYPVSCIGDYAYTFMAIKFVVPLEWGLFNWARIAKALLDGKASEFVDMLKGLFDEVRVVGVE